MPGYLIVLISILYVVIAGVVYGVIWKITKEEDLFCYIGAMFWPLLIIAIPIGLLVYWIVNHINIE